MDFLQIVLVVVATLVVSTTVDYICLKTGIMRVEFCARNGKKTATEEEIKDIVADAGDLQPDEKRMIHEILDLGDMTVREIMTPRVDMITVEDTETVEEAIRRMHGTGFSRLPMFHEDPDTITGIIFYKDLLGPFVDGKGDEAVAKYAYEPLFVPETKDVYPLLKQMQLDHQQMAIIVDEYGGTDGLITVEDIVEEIVGEISDETDDDDAFLTSTGKNEWVADGRCPVGELAEAGWPVEESNDYETLAGWLMAKIDVVPKVGDEFVIEGFAFRVQKMRRRRVVSVRVRRVDVGEGDGGEAAAAAEGAPAAE